jgi:hypothetical protein
MYVMLPLGKRLMQPLTGVIGSICANVLSSIDPQLLLMPA